MVSKWTNRDEPSNLLHGRQKRSAGFSHPGFFIFILFITGSILYFSGGVQVRCPSKIILKLPCLACGAGRALHELSHFNVFSAFLYNPLLIVSILFAAATIIDWLYLLVAQRRIAIAFSKATQTKLRGATIAFIGCHWLYLYLAHI